MWKENGTGCSICAGKKIVKSNSLKTLDPKLAKEWHPTKNGNLSPENIGIGSAKKVWWKCPKGGDHEWEAAVVQRKNNFKSVQNVIHLDINFLPSQRSGIQPKIRNHHMKLQREQF